MKAVALGLVVVGLFHMCISQKVFGNIVVLSVLTATPQGRIVIAINVHTQYPALFQYFQQLI